MRPYIARLVMVAGILSLIAVVLVGCGGAFDEQAKVEASLRGYIAGFAPEDSFFPIGAGAPRVKDNSCRNRHVKTDKGLVLWTRSVTVTRMKEGLALWFCVVKVSSLAMPVTVAVDASSKVVGAFPGKLKLRRD